MAAKIMLLSGKNRKGVVGQALAHPITVKIVDDTTGQPIVGSDVSFTQKDPDTINFPGGRAYADEQTDDAGIAEVRVSPLVPGLLTVNITCENKTSKVEIETVNTGIAQAGGFAAIPMPGGNVALVPPGCNHPAPAPVAAPPQIIILNR